MSSSMPEFEMPAAVDAPPRPEAPAPPTTVRPAHTAEPDASALDAPRRSGSGWRSVLVAGIVGAIIGAAIPGGVQVVERAAADAEVASLRTAALDYVTAIADGRAEDATAMVPLPRSAEAAPDAVLASADRIEDVEVRLVHIDGDVGSVEVRYRVQRTDIARTLEAERVDGAWRLTTTLAERVFVAAYDGSADVRVAGFAVGAGAGVHLYPGTYSVDEDDGPLVRTRSEPFAVDGDSATPTEVYVERMLMPEIARQAGEYGRAIVRACQAEPGCSVPSESELTAQGSYLHGFDGDAVDVSVQLLAGDDMSGRWFEVLLRIVLDETGQPSEWLCAPVDDYATPTEPCPAL